MNALSPEVREYAETPDRFAPVPEGSSVSLHDDGRVCVIQGTTWASVTGVHFADDEVDTLVAQVRELVAPGKRCVWWLGPSSRPADLVDQLRARGFETPDDGAPLVKAMALTEEPAAAHTGIEVRRIEAYDE